MRVIHPYGCLPSLWLIGQPACLFQKPDSGFHYPYIRLLFRDRKTGCKDCRSINHPSFTALLPPHDDETRPRTLVYTSRLLQLQINLIRLDDPDSQSLEARDSKGARIQVVSSITRRTDKACGPSIGASTIFLY
jgi:hypothetical protein